MSLKSEDLKGTILPIISIDEFEPKAGPTEDVIVVAFYLKDHGPAEDLNTFIQRGTVDNLDVEVSPNTDDDGHYLVFVEMERNTSFIENFKLLLKDITNLTGKMEWEVKTYLSGDMTFDPTDEAMYEYLILEPKEYVSKKEFTPSELQDEVEEIFKESMLTGLTFNKSYITMTGNNKRVIAEVIDAGDYDLVIGRNSLSESAFMVGKNPFEATVLQRMLGDYQILPIGNYLCVNRNDQVVLLKNTQIKYGD